MPKFIQSSWGERGQSLVFNKAHFRSSAILSICCGKAGMQDQDGESRCTEKVGLIPFPCRHVKSSRPLICTYENAGENVCFAGYTLPIITAVYICQFQHSFFTTEYWRVQEAFSDTAEYHLLVLRNSARYGYTGIAQISILCRISQKVSWEAYSTHLWISQISCQRAIPVQIHWIYQGIVVLLPIYLKMSCSDFYDYGYALKIDTLSCRSWNLMRNKTVQTWLVMFWWYFFLWLTFLYLQKCDMLMDLLVKI